MVGGFLCSRANRRALVVGVTLLAAIGLFALAAPATGWAATFSNNKGELDCNGDSTIQQALRLTMNCTDVRGYRGVNNTNVWDSRFYDNGNYIGHDEPDMTFLSSRPGSGNNVTWTETLPLDPSAAPTVSSPGSDVAHFFELSVAPWFSMSMCDPNATPLNPCTPQSDSNAPKCTPGGTSPCPVVDQGAGGAFMELQFYPPGFAPFVDAPSCDNQHWCSALTIDSLECKPGNADCNPACTEPVNFAFVQHNGVPAGPPAPSQVDLASFTQNSETLLMNPGDTITVHMWDAPVPGHPGQKAFKVFIKDVTTGQSGFMQASAANGFQNTSVNTCAGTAFNFQPEYNTAKKANITPWTALQANISTQFEIGHFEPCASLTDPTTFSPFTGVSDTFWNTCHGAYENAGPPDHSSGEPSDAFCFPAGDTHGDLNSAPDTITGCTDNLFQNGDLDFDGSAYWPEWPTGSTPTATFPGSFVQQLPSTDGGAYSQYFMQTDVALSESTCSADTTSGCTVPPAGPGNFYPFWSRVGSGSSCTIEFGNVTSGSGVSDFGGAAQYGTDQISTLGYPEFEGPVLSNSVCG